MILQGRDSQSARDPASEQLLAIAELGNVPARRGAEHAAIFAVELRRAFVADVMRGGGGSPVSTRHQLDVSLITVAAVFLLAGQFTDNAQILQQLDRCVGRRKAGVERLAS